jgi:ketosteroid isomerase-like protein
MSETLTSTTDAQAVIGGFEALARGDMAAFAAGFHEDASWNHRNDDRLGGIHAGRDALMEFIAESGRLTEGTLAPVPTAVMDNGDGLVAVVVHITASRPDGRKWDDTQVLLFAVENGLVRAVDQFLGDPAGATAFWS